MNEDVAEQLQVFPRWRQAVQDFLAAEFKPGDIVPHSWLEDHFGIPPVRDEDTMTGRAYRERQFKWLTCVEAFKSELLEEHQVCLASVFGEGYRVTPPGEQTALATDSFEGEAKKAFRKAALRLKHIRTEELTAAQRRENMDAVARLSMLRGMLKAIE